LAVDRNNARVADLYHPLHPAVLNALQDIVAAAHSEGKTVSICGELAGDPRAAPLLLAMGFDQLSMNSANLPRVKKVLRSLSLTDAMTALQDVSNLHSPAQVGAVVDKLMEQRGLERYVRLSQD